jgi:deoxyadenosine/deoxycytidine kinase
MKSKNLIDLIMGPKAVEEARIRIKLKRIEERVERRLRKFEISQIVKKYSKLFGNNYSELNKGLEPLKKKAEEYNPKNNYDTNKPRNVYSI